jgi:hypothetical protein
VVIETLAVERAFSGPLYAALFKSALREEHPEA